MNNATIKFIRCLHSDKDLWKDVTSIIDRDLEYSQSAWDYITNILEETLEEYAVSEYCPLSFEELRELKMEEVVDLIAYDCTAQIERIVNPFERHEERKRITFLKSRINGKTKIAHEDFGGSELLDVSNEPGISEAQSKVEGIVHEVSNALIKAKVANEFVQVGMGKDG